MGRRELKERDGSSRRKKKSHKIYAFIVLALAAAILAAVVFLLFYVQKIEVKGNDYVTEQEIVDAVQNDDLSVNALYILGKYASLLSARQLVYTHYSRPRKAHGQ